MSDPQPISLPLHTPTPPVALHTHTQACSHDHGCAHGSPAVHDTRDIICLDHVSYSYHGNPGNPGNPALGSAASGNPVNGTQRLALNDVTLHIESGCSLGVIGPNGAGKSTLVKIILGLLTGYTGNVTIMGLAPQRACARGDIIGYVPQRAHAEWRFPVTARQVVHMGLVGKTGLFRWHTREDRAYADEMIHRVGMSDLHARPVSQLSGGQQQRLFIARALAARPKILILDEPTVGIDEVGQRQFAKLIHELHESLGLTLLIVSHDMQAIAACCNRVAVLNRAIHYHDAPQGLTADVLREVFQHDIVPILPRA